MKRPQHRTDNKDKSFYENAAFYYSSVCSPFVDVKQASLIFKAINGELDMDDYENVINPRNASHSKYKKTRAKIRNYDILSPVFMLLMGEKRRRGLRYTVIARNSDIESQRKQLEEELLDQMLVQNLMNEFIRVKRAQGEEVDIEERYDLTIEKIQKDVESVQDTVAIMGQNALDYIRDYCELDRKFMEQWVYWICTGRAVSFKETFRDEVIYKAISPLEINVLKSRDVRYLEDAEAVTRRTRMPLTEILDKFQDVEGFSKIQSELESRLGDGIGQTFGANNTLQGYSEIDTPEQRAAAALWSNITSSLGGGEEYGNGSEIDVEHIVFTSLVKIGLLKAVNIFGEVFEEEVDSDFKPREGEKVEWKYVQCKCHVYLIDNKYVIGGEILPHTLASFYDPSQCKGPYNGCAFNLPHTSSTGIIGKGINFQVKYNTIHYYAERAIAKNMGKIISMPLGLVPDEKGHTTESTLFYMDAHGIAFIDDSKKNFQVQANAFKIIDADLGAYISQLFDYLRIIKQEWKDLVGITPGREGNMQNSNDGKALMENSVFRSSIMTEEWFAEFEELEQKDLQTLMELSKYAFQKGKKAVFLNSDKKRVLLEINPDEFLYSDYLVSVHNSGKDLEDLERARGQAQALAQNMNGKFTPVLKLLRSNNISELISELDKAEQEFELMQQQMQESQNEANLKIAEMETARAQAELDYKYYNTDKIAETQRMKIQAETEAELLGNKTGDDSGSADFATLVANNREREKMAMETKLKQDELRAKERMNKENNETKKYVADKQGYIAKINKN